MFDSGVGGLTVMKRLLADVPEARVVYFGDTARVPYGNRSKEELIQIGEEIITFLIGQGAEAIIMACNTSSALALATLQERFRIPIVGTIDQGAGLAVQLTRTGRIGLIATEGTVRSKAFALAISQALSSGILPLDASLRAAWQSGEQPVSLVRAQACPLFVPIVEAGLANSEEARVIAKFYLAPLLAAQVDSVILGCTHYPFLGGVLQEIIGADIRLIDPAEAIVHEVCKILTRLDEEQQGTEQPGLERPSAYKDWRVRYYVSGNPDLFAQVGNTLLDEPITEVRQHDWYEQ
ncbi:MAG: glutamate racemase [Peptococcaceae bacterium]|nr:glutamate racemase [Peptococcaceae bacterium]